jgi:hypothetical protein
MTTASSSPYTTQAATPMLDAARFYRNLGFSLLPLRGKIPALDHWKHLTQRLPTHAELLFWFYEERRHDIGIICGQVSRIVVLDGDSQEMVEWLERQLPRTGMQTKTAKGKHFYYRLREGQHLPPRVHVNQMMLDFRGEGSYAAAAPSIHSDTGQRYERIGSWNMKDVPFFDPSWVDLLEPEGRSLSRKGIRNLDGYLAKVESLQGSNGSAGLVRACALCRDAGLTEAEAIVKLIVWNQSPVVQPPWSMDELARAVSRTYQKGKGQ